MELIEIVIGNETRKVRKLSAYQVSKLLGPGARDLADIHVEMILASVVEPKFTREDVLAMSDDEEKYFALVIELERINEKGIRALGNYMLSSAHSQQTSKTNLNST